jgi:pyrroloquinoline-quinone synthase
MTHDNESRIRDFLRQLDNKISEHGLLKHPFYQQWNAGKLSKTALVEYAKQYYGHVSAFPTYLSAVHSRCDDSAARRLLLENLMEEEWGEENHPELWLRFADGLGVDRKTVKSAEPLPETASSIATLKRLTRAGHFIGGVAALYAYESQVPEIARSKREGLQAFYGISEPRSVSYFTVHETADVEHREAERDILSRHCTDAESRTLALNSAQASARAMWTFLDGIYERYCTN